MLIIASILLVLCGCVHSILGEKYILIRLFKRDNLPHLLGSDQFTKGTPPMCMACHKFSLIRFCSTFGVNARISSVAFNP